MLIWEQAMMPKSQTAAAPQTQRLCCNWYFLCLFRSTTPHLLSRIHDLRNWHNSCINRLFALWFPVGFQLLDSRQWDSQARHREGGRRGSLKCIPRLSPPTFTLAPKRGPSPPNYLLWILIAVPLLTLSDAGSVAQGFCITPCWFPKPSPHLYNNNPFNQLSSSFPVWVCVCYLLGPHLLPMPGHHPYSSWAKTFNIYMQRKQMEKS